MLPGRPLRAAALAGARRRRRAVAHAGLDVRKVLCELLGCLEGVICAADYAQEVADAWARRNGFGAVILTEEG